jgi:hypothetical protein
VAQSNFGWPLDDFKAYCSRKLKEFELIAADEKPWSRHGSTRYLWDEESVSRAVDYVLEGQGADLPRGLLPDGRGSG